MGETMRKLLVITIDTEIDRSPDGTVSKEETYRSVLEGIPDRLDPLFLTHDAKATYLVSGEVLERDDCVDVLRSLKHAETGTLLHGEMVEPFRAEGELGGRAFGQMQSYYGERLERMKMTVLTDLYRERIGRRPVVFRAGRFGAGESTAHILHDLGYKVDSSVTPGIDWDTPEGRADFTFSPSQPYRVDGNIAAPGNGELLEVPITVRSGWMRRAMHLTPDWSMARKANRLMNKVFLSSWFRPSFQTDRQMIAAGRYELKRSADKELVVLNLMLSSTESVGGASLSAPNEDDCHELLTRLNTALTWARDMEFKIVALSDLPYYFPKM